MGRALPWLCEYALSRSCRYRSATMSRHSFSTRCLTCRHCIDKTGTNLVAYILGPTMIPPTSGGRTRCYQMHMSCICGTHGIRIERRCASRARAWCDIVRTPAHTRTHVSLYSLRTCTTMMFGRLSLTRRTCRWLWTMGSLSCIKMNGRLT